MAITTLTRDPLQRLKVDAIGYGAKDAIARGRMHGVNDIKAFT